MSGIQVDGDFFFCYLLKLTVYLRADPTTCQGRIKKRARMEENDVPLVSILNFKVKKEVFKIFTEISSVNSFDIIRKYIYCTYVIFYFA